MAVFRLGRLAVNKDHAGRNGVGPLDVRVVEALDAPRLKGQAKVLLHLAHDAVAVALRVDQLHVFQALYPVGTGVALRQLHGGPLVAALRNHHFDLGRNHLGLVRHQDQPGLTRKAFAQFRQAEGHKFRVGFLQALAQLEGEALNDRPVANVQHVDVSVLSVAQQRIHVDRPQSRVEHGRLRLVGIEALQTLFDELRGFKLLGGSVSHHLAVKAFAGPPEVAAQQLPGAVNVGEVAALVLSAFAGRQAALNVELQAGPVLAQLDRRRVHRKLAGAQREHFFDDVEHSVHHLA